MDPDEKRAVREAVLAGIPYFGICFGVQLLADVFGARSFQGPEPEIGVNQVFLTANAQHDPVFRGFPPDLEVCEWHSNHFSLPRRGAVGAIPPVREPGHSLRPRGLRDSVASRASPRGHRRVARRISRDQGAVRERHGEGAVARLLTITPSSCLSCRRPDDSSLGGGCRTRSRSGRPVPPRHRGRRTQVPTRCGASSAGTPSWRKSTWRSPRRAEARAPCWSCAGRPGSARARCSRRPPTALVGSLCCGPRASKAGTPSSRSPGSPTCASRSPTAVRRSCPDGRRRSISSSRR